ncbi:MAG: hypothetical protein MAG471_01679 [Acidimicrobiaceae bacterium]|nr:hypothetical protein [Acidimicrobiaceae bacterium]
MRAWLVALIGVLFVAVVLLLGTCNPTTQVFDTTPATTTATATTSAPVATTTPTTTVAAQAATTTLDPEMLGTLPPLDDLGMATLDYQSTVSTVGLDTVIFGMTANAAQRAAGTRFTPITPVGECYLATPDNAPAGITFWVVGGTVERVDIDTNEITTRSGAGIGNTEGRIIDMFGERIQTSPLPDGSGNLLAYVPRDQSDKVFRVMFQSDGEKIVRFWSGRLPWAEELNGCPVQ